MIHKGTQRLETSRLILRQITLEDAEEMHNGWATDPEVTKFLIWKPHENLEETINLIKTWIKDYENIENYLWAIEYQGKIIGTIGVMSSLNSYEIGYCIAKDYWGKGIVTEALGAVIDYMFDECDCHKLIAKYSAENVGSGKVMEKCGMVKEGYLREHFLLNSGEYSDNVLYGILKSDRIVK